jgi:hypothetical protein
MPEAERYVQAHLASGTIPPPQLVDGITQEPITPSAVQVVDALLRSYVVESLRDLLAERRPFERGQGFALATAELLASYRRSLAMRTGPATITIPLLGVTGSIQEPHPLTEQVHLRPLPSGERARIWEESRGSAHLVAGHLFDNVQFVLRGTYEPGDIAGTISTAIRTEAADVLTALRLYKDGRVGILPIIERIPGPAVGIMLGVDLSAELGLSATTGFQHAPYDYRLDAADLSSLGDLVARLQAVRRGKTGLSIALRRFNQSYARDPPEDRVIDLTPAGAIEAHLSRFERQGRATALSRNTLVWASRAKNLETPRDHR